VKADDAPRVAELTRRLSEAEATIEALLSGQIDAVVDPASRSPVLLAKAQQALRDERDRAQRYLDTADVILLALDVSGRVSQINRKGCDVLGWTERDLIGRDFVEICIPARLRAATTTRFGEVVAGDLSVVEATVLTKSGDERLIEWRNTLQYDRDGALVGTFSSGADITDRSRALEALQTAEERTRFALEAASVGLWDLDRATGIVAWSAILEAQHGLAPGTFGGTMQAFMACIHPEDRASVVETIDRATRSGADFALHYRSLWPDGTVRWLSGAGRVVLDAQGGPVRAVGISMDVTERRALEEQYRQSQKMEAIGLLASGVAHDFNNLLTVILGFTELVSAELPKQDRHAQDLTEVIKAAQSAAGLTRQLLAFSRQQVLNAAPLDVNGLITEMTAMLGRLIGEHIEITLSLAPDLPMSVADRSQLEQVIMNLAVNARDAMPTGGCLMIRTKEVTLESSLFDREEVMPGRYVELAIADTGVGMTKETQRRLFEPFFTTKEKGKGTGLGLSTSYGIVRQSKGHIAVDSELGHGTTFKVFLPCAPSDATVQTAAPAATAHAAARASGTVLLVEDEAGVRLLSKRILERGGYRVLEASNGDDAERLFTAHGATIDLVVSDVVMPGCGGPELVARLHVQAPALRVLYMSGYAEQSAAHSAGIDRGAPFIEKPFTAAGLLRDVRDALDR
jgi:two-component system cell cycle sensor histidine kinase/response regulator CckA